MYLFLPIYCIYSRHMCNITMFLVDVYDNVFICKRIVRDWLMKRLLCVRVYVLYRIWLLCGPCKRDDAPV